MCKHMRLTKNILMTSGFVSPNNVHRAKIVEVSPEDNSEVFDNSNNVSRISNNKSYLFEMMKKRIYQF